MEIYIFLFQKIFPQINKFSFFNNNIYPFIFLKSLFNLLNFFPLQNHEISSSILIQLYLMWFSKILPICSQIFYSNENNVFQYFVLILQQMTLEYKSSIVFSVLTSLCSINWIFKFYLMIWKSYSNWMKEVLLLLWKTKTSFNSVTQFNDCYDTFSNFKWIQK
jgi:hypothetical protein